MWFVATDSLVDTTRGTLAQRNWEYRPALMSWLLQLSGWLDSQLAVNILIDAYLELPARLRQLAATQILNGFTTDGSALLEVEKRGGDRLRFLLAFRYLAEGSLRACERLYGRPLAQRVMREFNQASARAEWGVWFWGDSRLNADARRAADLMALSNLLQAALADLLQRLAYYTGNTFVRLSLVQAYDGLSWQLRELAAPTLLSRLPWAYGLQTDTNHNLADFLHKLPHFNSLSEEALLDLARQARVEQWPANKKLYGAGRKLAWAYVIQAGRVEVMAQTPEAKRLTRALDYGALVGYDEILQGKPALAEARTVSLAVLVRLPVAATRRALEDAPLDPEAALLSRIPVFRDLSFKQLRQLAERLQPRDLSADEVVVRQGELGRELFVIGWGELQVTLPDSEGQERIVAQMGPGEFFGELALLRDEPRTATVRALNDAQVWTLSASDYAAFLKEVPALQTTLEQIASRRKLELQTA
jgi:CRP-like cAMP-binding protein